MSKARLNAGTPRRDTQTSDHPTPMIVHNYNGPVNWNQNNVGQASNAIFGDNRGNLSQYGGQNERKAVDEAKAMEYLIANMAPGAIHDSNERCDAPKCMEETRVAVQEDIMSWIAAGDQDARSKRIMWVTGPAGTGKTAILGTIAETCKEKGTLAASFFFSAFAGSANRRTKRCLVPTLAFQLMGHGGLTETREHVLSSIAEGQGIIFTKNLKEQFIAMVLNPLRKTQEQGNGTKEVPRIIIIDGLDECDAEQYEDSSTLSSVSALVRTRQKADDQKEILSLLLSATSDPAFPFRVLIASRPEKAIRSFFSTDGRTCTQELFLDDSYDPDADIALFYDAKFSIICRDLGIEPEVWPGRDTKLILVSNASGQFIYAATVMRYIEGSPNSSKPRAQNSGHPSTPHRRLEHILGLTPTTGAERSPHNPLEALDALYRLLLETCPDPELSMNWLRAIQAKDYAQSPVWLLRLVLEASPGEEQCALGSLASLLPTQLSKESLESPYMFYHKSFLDFIADRTRCGEAFLSDEQELVWKAQRFFQTLDRRKLVFHCFSAPY
ncbi:hypothetical protein D9611_006846 [Ephemerocybe angulata]|uniref:NACHT domain-containing protein n=1 Tax=Ephemerocybe angulata TaxID=980116 RepID=A0A8H5B058_9AGAR|nr:hypothetical protein D9611_006846 [Tulosesus angulatus]